MVLQQQALEENVRALRTDVNALLETSVPVRFPKADEPGPVPQVPVPNKPVPRPQDDAAFRPEPAQYLMTIEDYLSKIDDGLGRLEQKPVLDTEVFEDNVQDCSYEEYFPQDDKKATEDDSENNKPKKKPKKKKNKSKDKKTKHNRSVVILGSPDAKQDASGQTVLLTVLIFGRVCLL